MTLNDISSIANLLAAIGVLITLIYLSRQVRQGNMLARYQARQRMVEQAQEELYHWASHPSLRDSFVKSEPLTAREQEEVHSVPRLSTSKRSAATTRRQPRSGAQQLKHSRLQPLAD